MKGCHASHYELAKRKGDDNNMLEYNSIRNFTVCYFSTFTGILIIQARSHLALGTSMSWSYHVLLSFRWLVVHRL